uniref:DDE Tnp4 domain-containing protein n=1 Tax=Globisporangium ultimum (strain ATCC 200006 / CBS 805.95 / DAOM BR144) TaxID=431595 RepID=K3W7K8_GLOUD
MIRQILVGFPGSVLDNRQYLNMDISINPSRYFNRDQYLLGNAACAVSPHLIRPHKSSQSKILENKKVKYLLSKQ